MASRLSFVPLLLIAFPAFAQAYPQTAPPPSVSTSGTAELLVEPDQIEFTVGVETVSASLTTAKELNDQAVARTIAAAKRNHVDAASIQTDYINIEPTYDYEHRDRPALTGYIVRRALVIVSKDIPGFETLLSDLIQSGANHVRSIRFMTTRLREHRDAARKQATQAALEKARLLAQSLGRTAGKAMQISEQTNWWASSYSSWWGGSATSFANVSSNIGNSASSASTSESPMAPGRISVTATVNVTFALE